MDLERLKTARGSGATGYWRNRGAFDCYVNGHFVGAEPTAERAQTRLDRIRAETGEAD